MIEFAAYASSSAGNLYLVSDGVSSLLLECGLPVKAIRKALDYKLHEVEGVILSHEHMDHAKAAKDIIAAGIDLYCSSGTAQALELTGPRVRLIEALTQFKVGPWIILPFETRHDAAEPLGFLIQNGQDKALFATDTFYVKHRFVGLTGIFIECNYSKKTISKDMHPAQRKRLFRSHMSLETLLKLLEANDLSKVREIRLLHLSDDNSNEQLFKDTIQGATGIPVYCESKQSNPLLNKLGRE